MSYGVAIIALIIVLLDSPRILVVETFSRIRWLHSQVNHGDDGSVAWLTGLNHPPSTLQSFLKDSAGRHQILPSILPNMAFSTFLWIATLPISGFAHLGSETSLDRWHAPGAHKVSLRSTRQEPMPMQGPTLPFPLFNPMFAVSGLSPCDGSATLRRFYRKGRGKMSSSSTKTRTTH